MISLKNWNVCFIALASFLAGALMIRVQEVKAQNGHVFELRVYHAVPGKLPVMESRFRNTTSKVLARHNLNVVGYWVAESENEFIFLFAHQSIEEAKKNWEAMRADPEFQEVVKAEHVEKTLEKAEITWMRATDFSPMK